MVHFQYISKICIWNYFGRWPETTLWLFPTVRTFFIPVIPLHRGFLCTYSITCIHQCRVRSISNQASPGPPRGKFWIKNSQLPTLRYFIICKASIKHSKITFNLGWKSTTLYSTIKVHNFTQHEEDNERVQ